MTITVLEEYDSAYIVEWHYTHTAVDRINVEVEEDPVEQRIDEMFNNIKIVFETDEFGVYKRLLNKDEMVQMISDSLDVLVEEEMSDMGEEGVMMVQMMKEMFNSEEMQEELIRDIWNYHYYFGDVFVSDTIVTYEDELENRLGGENIPLKGTVSIVTDKTNKTIAINDFRKVDEQKTKDAINAGAKKLKAPKKKKLKKQLQKK